MTRSALLLLLAILAVATPAVAGDGDDGGGNSGSGGGSDDGDDDNGGDSNGADSADDDEDGDDSDRARDGVSSGAILPLASFLSGVENQFGARMINAELHRRSGRLIYALELITPVGRVLDVRVDAATARILRVYE